MCSHKRRFRTRHVTSQNQKPWQRSFRQVAHFVPQGHDEYTKKQKQ